MARWQQGEVSQRNLGGRAGSERRLQSEIRTPQRPRAVAKDDKPKTRSFKELGIVPNADQVEMGSWYLCAVCRNCQNPTPVMKILKDAPIGGDDSGPKWS